MGYIEFIRNKVGHECVFFNCVGGVIYNNEGQILLQRRADKNMWGFPGGIIELGESVEEALIREIKEETGLTIQITRLIGIYSKYFDDYPNGDKAQPILHCFECEITNGSLDTNDEETLELAFFDIDKTPELVNNQHTDILNDIRKSSNSVFIR